MRLFGRKKKRSDGLDEVLRGHEPPTLPQGVLRLLALVRDPDSDIRAITEALSWNPGLVLRVLRLVNSAAFGLARQVEGVQHAVSMLGRAQLEQIVLGVAVKDNLPKGAVRGFEPDRFWQAAFFRAALARYLASRLHPTEEARSFTCGLLQDMAVPVLAHARTDEYGHVLEAWHATPASELAELEREAIGIGHDEVGARLAEEWGLPGTLTDAIRHHHSEEKSDLELPPAIRLVAIHRETQHEHGLEALLEQARTRYGLDPDWLRQAVGDSVTQSQQLSRALV